MLFLYFPLCGYFMQQLYPFAVGTVEPSPQRFIALLANAASDVVEESDLGEVWDRCVEAPAEIRAFVVKKGTKPKRKLPPKKKRLFRRVAAKPKAAGEPRSGKRKTVRKRERRTASVENDAANAPSETAAASASSSSSSSSGPQSSSASSSSRPLGEPRMGRPPPKTDGARDYNYNPVFPPTKTNLSLIPEDQLHCLACKKRRRGQHTGVNKHLDTAGCLRFGVAKDGVSYGKWRDGVVVGSLVW